MNKGKPGLVEAQEIPDWGGAFRKERGTYVYLKISKASAAFLKLDPAFIYGVTFNGNVAAVPLKTRVVPMTLKNMLENVAETERWEKDVGVKR